MRLRRHQGAALVFVDRCDGTDREPWTGAIDGLAPRARELAEVLRAAGATRPGAWLGPAALGSCLSPLLRAGVVQLDGTSIASRPRSAALRVRVREAPDGIVHEPWVRVGRVWERLRDGLLAIAEPPIVLLGGAWLELPRGCEPLVGGLVVPSAELARAPALWDVLRRRGIQVNAPAILRHDRVRPALRLLVEFSDPPLLSRADEDGQFGSTRRRDRGSPRPVLQVRPKLVYGPLVASPGPGPSILAGLPDGTLHLVKRDRASEAVLLRRFHRGLAPHAAAADVLELRGDDALDALGRWARPSSGVDVQGADALGPVSLEPSIELDGPVFGDRLEVRVSFPGATTADALALVRANVAGRRYARLGDGRWAAIAGTAAIETAVRVLRVLDGSSEGQLPVHALPALVGADPESFRDSVRLTARAQALLRDVCGRPPALAARLRSRAGLSGPVARLLASAAARCRRRVPVLLAAPLDPHEVLALVAAVGEGQRPRPAVVIVQRRELARWAEAAKRVMPDVRVVVAGEPRASTTIGGPLVLAPFEEIGRLRGLAALPHLVVAVVGSTARHVGELPARLRADCRVVAWTTTDPARKRALREVVRFLLPGGGAFAVAAGVGTSARSRSTPSSPLLHQARWLCLDGRGVGSHASKRRG